jgi:transcriptional antiterminator
LNIKVLELDNIELRIYLYLKLNKLKKQSLNIQEISAICKISERQVYRKLDDLNFKDLAEYKKVKNGLYKFVIDEADKMSDSERILKEFPEFDIKGKLSDYEIAVKLGNKCLRGQADKNKYRKFLCSNKFGFLFEDRKTDKMSK